MNQLPDSLAKYLSRCFLILALCLYAQGILAQHVAKSYYGSSKKVYCIERWNKSNKRAHFSIFFEDGKLKADGYLRRDRKNKYHKHPDSVFHAYGPDGKVLQEMSMNKDSILVNTYSPDGALLNKIWAGPHFCYEEEYYTTGKIKMRTECTPPDDADFFTDHFKIPADFVKVNKNLRWPEPLFPVRYGEAGNDGVSPSGTFKIYFNANIYVHGADKGSCRTKAYNADGQIDSMLKVYPGDK